MLERVGLRLQLARLPVSGRWAYTQLVVMGGWVLFRSRDLPTAQQIYAGLIGFHGISAISFDMHIALNPSVVMPLLAGCAVAVLPRWLRLPSPAKAVRVTADAAWTFGLLILAMISVAVGAYSPFLYFRF